VRSASLVVAAYVRQDSSLLYSGYSYSRYSVLYHIPLFVIVLARSINP